MHLTGRKENVTTPALFVEESALAEQQNVHSCISSNRPAPTWRMVCYTEPAIIMGRSQRHNEAQSTRASQQAVKLVRRKSGGGAVMAGPDLFSLLLVLPSQHALSRASSVVAYQWLGNLWKQVLASYGINAHLPEAAEASRSQQQATSCGVDWACYASVSHGELLSDDGRKLLGVAQIRNRYCCALTSGVYLRRPDWSLLCAIVAGDQSGRNFLQDFNTDLQSVTGFSTIDISHDIAEKLTHYLNIEMKNTAGSSLPETRKAR